MPKSLPLGAHDVRGPARIPPVAGTAPRSAHSPREGAPPVVYRSGVSTAWEAFADALLVRQALLVRMGQGRPPDDFAGLYVDDADVERLIGELPGFVTVPPDHGTAEKQLNEMVAEAREAFEQSLGDTSVFASIVAHARLAFEEAEVLALAAAIELDLRRQRLVGYIQDNVALTRLTLAGLGRILPGPHSGPLAVGADARLPRAGLVRVEGDGPWASLTVVVPAGVAWALAGDQSLDPALPPEAQLLDGRESAAGGAPLAVVTGGDRGRRLQLAATRTAGHAFVVSPPPIAPSGWEALVRQVTLTGRGVVLEVAGTLAADARRWIERADHLAWAICSPQPLPLESLPRRPWVEHTAEPTHATEEDWRRMGLTGAEGHRLSLDQLALVAVAARSLDGDVNEAVRRLAGGHLEGRAIRIRPRRGWADLVVPAEQLAQLRELTIRYRHRDTVYERWGFTALPSAGLVALFAGPSGTGKTLAAEIIAGDLGLDLYKIDLSSVVSKYIGETEKHLEALFDAAEAAGLVLFFDEADALFGRRSEVSDAHDRYANIEVSYLLQRIERYDGLLIMATNLQNNIDSAFLRRIHVAVDFPVPDEAERRAIWCRSFPSSSPTLDLDYDFLARQFKLAGGAIRNVALHAAFQAAEADQPITMEDVVLGLKRELHKLGRLCTRAEFDRYFDLVRQAH